MVLKDILEEEERGFIVVDALDECDSLHHRIEVLEFLSWLIVEVKCDLRILVTSRPEHDIVNAMTELKVPKRFVPFDTDSVNQDIHAHLVGLMCRAPYSRWAKSIQNEVITQITAESDGVFRWADLQIQSLERFSRKPDIRRVLARLPKGLNQTYERMLDTIDEDYVQDASAVLRWLCYSRLPLTLKQLAEIAAFRRSTGNQVVFDPEYRFEDPSEILAILTGLITVLEYNEPHEDPQDNMVILSHFSVSQYLKSRDVTRPEFQMIDHDSAWFMVQSSLAYLGHYDNPLERLVPYPLLLGACVNLSNFARGLLEESSTDQLQDLMKLITPYLRSKSYAISLALSDRDISLHVWGLTQAVNTGDIRLMQFFLDSGDTGCLGYTGHHFALHGLSLEEPSCFIPRSNASLDHITTIEEFKMHITQPSVWARAEITDEHILETVEWLLAHVSVDFNAVDVSGESFLLRLARLSNTRPGLRKVMERLLTVDEVDINTKNRLGWGLLVIAITAKDDWLFETIMACNKTVQIDPQDHYGWTPLDWALYQKQDSMAQRLMSASQDPGHNAKDARNNAGSLAVTETESWRSPLGEVWSVNFSHDGLRLAVSGDACDIFIIETYNNDSQVRLSHNYAGVGNTAWSPNDHLIVACSQDRHARIYDSVVSKPRDIIVLYQVWLTEEYLA
ncbi:hypothetical protein PG999_000399 [Apiospora kogelbergensis]|uniref:Nephrocystin 3-like N-terminal domain-containing protein n=1 Tax=Apiospora kogelbergensis TaxID=1337665 RepID=A0AAW0RBS2_9PEZI